MRATKALTIIALACVCLAPTGSEKPRFRAIAFFTGKEDPAHISFLSEAVPRPVDRRCAAHFVFG